MGKSEGMFKDGKTWATVRESSTVNGLGKTEERDGVLMYIPSPVERLPFNVCPECGQRMLSDQAICTVCDKPAVHVNGWGEYCFWPDPRDYRWEKHADGQFFTMVEVNGKTKRKRRRDKVERDTSGSDSPTATGSEGEAKRKRQVREVSDWLFGGFKQSTTDSPASDEG